MRVCIGVNEYGRVGARRKELEEEKQRKMLQNAEEAKRKLQVSCVRICLMGTAALYRVCSTGLR